MAIKLEHHPHACSFSNGAGAVYSWDLVGKEDRGNLFFLGLETIASVKTQMEKAYLSKTSKTPSRSKGWILRNETARSI